MTNSCNNLEKCNNLWKSMYQFWKIHWTWEKCVDLDIFGKKLRMEYVLLTYCWTNWQFFSNHIHTNSIWFVYCYYISGLNSANCTKRVIFCVNSWTFYQEVGKNLLRGAPPGGCSSKTNFLDIRKSYQICLNFPQPPKKYKTFLKYVFEEVRELTEF